MGVINSHMFQETLLILSDRLISGMRALHGDRNSSTAGQEIGQFLWNSNGRYRVNGSSLLDQ